MKKVLKVALLALITMSAFNVSVKAQGWNITHTDGDELKGIEPSYISIFQAEDGDAFIINGGDNPGIAILSDNRIFDYDSNGYVSALIGFYIDGALDHKETAKFFVGKGRATMGALFASRNKKIFLDIINHLRSKGDVRVVADKYSGSDYDVTATMNPDIKF